MTHLHVPDGVLPWWVVLLSLLAGGIAVAWTLLAVAPGEQVRFLPRVGVMGGALLVAMSIPVGPGVHLTLAPLAGMLLGARGGFLAAFFANAALSVFGHGGLTTVAVNGLFVGGQAVAGAALFVALLRRLGPRRAAALSSGATLLLAAGGALLLLERLEMDGHGQGHAGHGWIGPAVIAALSLAVAVVEAALTGSVVAFLARARADLVLGGAPTPAEGS